MGIAFSNTLDYEEVCYNKNIVFYKYTKLLSHGKKLFYASYPDIFIF